MGELGPLAAADLRLRLRAVDRALDAAVRRRAERSARVRTEGAPVRLAVTAEQAHRLLAEVGRAAAEPPDDRPLEPTGEEQAARLALRARAESCVVCPAGTVTVIPAPSKTAFVPAIAGP